MSISQSLYDTRPKSPPSAAVKLTRSQLKGKNVELEHEPKSLVDGIGQTPEEQQQTMREETINNIPIIETSGSANDDAISEPVTQSAIEPPASPLPSAMPNVISHLRTDTPAKRSTSNKENVEPENMALPQTPNYDVLEDAVVTSATPLGPSRRASSRPEDHIVALDELDDAVENVNKDIPEVQTSPEKSKSKKESNDTAKRDSKKVVPVVRTTKASQARISMAQNSKEATGSRAPSLGRPRPSTTLGRASSVRQSSITKPEPAGKRFPSTSGSKDEKSPADGEKKEVVIPHSKPRPVSLSFPTPPPPAKSKKAPTQSTFKLPGEAISEKLKAAKEARMQREAEEVEKRKVFKARPVPAALSKAPSVRQTTASKARESIMAGKDFRASTSAPGMTHKRANSVAATRAMVPSSRVVSKDASKPSTTTSKLAPEALAVKKRPSTALANMSMPRSSFAASAGPSAARVPSGPTKGTAKGKEVFNRAAAAKEGAAKEKLEKEAATKKARAEAAERSRQASRDWAEKQKKKQLAAKQLGKIEEHSTVAGEPAAVEVASVAEAPMEA